MRRRNVALPEHPRPEWLRSALVAEVYTRDAATVPPSATFADVIATLLGLPAGQDLYVVGTDGRYQGAIVLDALKGHLDHRHVSIIVAGDLVDRSVTPVTVSTPLGALARRFADVASERLPVVEPESGCLLGTVSKGALIRRGRY